MKLLVIWKKQQITSNLKLRNSQTSKISILKLNSITIFIQHYSIWKYIHFEINNLQISNNFFFFFDLNLINYKTMYVCMYVCLCVDKE